MTFMRQVESKMLHVLSVNIRGILELKYHLESRLEVSDLACAFTNSNLHPIHTFLKSGTKAVLQ